VQAELPWALGPPEGRYVVRGHAGEPTHVLVVTPLGAARARTQSRGGGRLRRHRRRQAAPEPPATDVPVTRVTLVAAAPFESGAEAERWLRGADGEAEAGDAFAVLARVLHAHRIATADPAVREPARDQALVVRIGLGEGEEVAEGRWREAVELPPPRRARSGRAAALRPQERLAALLAARDAALACEELTLRARADLDAGRHREAAFQLRVALEAALAELEPWSGRGDLAERLEALRAERAAVADAAAAALGGGLSDAQAADVERVVGRLEAALRARTAAGLAES
jgi:hypothetical protein